MPKEALEFLDGQRVGVISVEMPDGAPHGATVHFAYQKDPITFVFLTDKKYRKMQPLISGGTTRASFVVGTDEETMRTCQFDGLASLPENDQLEKVYFAKFPDKRKDSPDDVFFIFRPTWWRYTDYKAPKEQRVTESQ